ncbi:sigma-54-dependent Fis family transcriptional regulator [Actinomadura sp. SCN-SB]|uniref:sigma-54-dependent Fis family transcriptional regulator n=1 Tax=Actinomadura sp. SCN-SB TaxID=3373092 RepID=UPI0037529555
MRGREAWRRTLAIKERFLAAGDPDLLPPEDCGVRREIVLSWRRSLLSGVDAAATDLPRDEAAVPPDRLVRAARPVMDRLEAEIAGSRVWAFLADGECRLVRHVVGDPSLVPQLEARGVFPGAWFAEDVVGTNGLGTAVEQRRPFIVAGSEHFRAYESEATTAGAPVRDPATGRLVGLLNINCRYESTNGLLLPLVTELAREIEARLRAGASPGERALLEMVARASKRSPQPVAGLGEELFIANPAALTLLDGADYEPLKRWAREVSASGRERTSRLRLGSGLVVSARCRPLSGSAAVVSLTPVTAAHPPSPWQRLLDQVERARATRLPVLLRGERGTGKTVLSRRLHETGPLTVVDAAVDPLPPALDEGTVVLRHLDALPPERAAPVAARLESARARFVATASEREPGDGLRALFERFPVVLDVPPLRERMSDLPALVNEIIAELRPGPPRPRCTPDALAALSESRWPGNLRQLRQVVATALTRSLSCDITVEDLPGDHAPPGRARRLTKLERAERHALLTALRDASWDREAAARDLGISRATIYRKLKRFGIKPPQG